MLHLFQVVDGVEYIVGMSTKYQKVNQLKCIDLCILVLANLLLYLVPYLHQFSAVEYVSEESAFFGAILTPV